MTLKTFDGKNIAADSYDAKNPKGWIVYTHMMPATKESWRDLALKLQNLGYAGLAIDLRGHGASDGGPDSYENFSNEENQASIYDLEAAVGFLINAGASKGKIYFIGASIGANLSLKYISGDWNYKSAVLLSPGINYYGLMADLFARNLKPGQRVLFVSSRDDVNSGINNAKQNQELFKLVPEGTQKELIVYEKAGHGTNMFTTHESPNLMDKITEFIQNG